MRRIKRCTALAAVLMLLLPAAVPERAYGAERIDTGVTCAVEFWLTNLKTGTGTGADDPEYGNLTEGETDAPVAVHLYKVADISEYGAYTVTKTGEGADELQKSLNGAGPDTDPDAWLKMAEQAEILLGVDRENGVFPNGTGTKGTVGSDGTVTFSGLETGLYLAAAEPAQSAVYRYTFTPYLISLPDNRYYQTGSDAWIYELTGNDAVGLKAAWEQRYAKLVIQKTLDSYNQTLGGASFIFGIEAEDADGQTVYNDVMSLVFQGTGTRSVTIEGKIPAGTDVTVTELYAGASYQISGEGLKTISGIEADSETTVDFTNHYDEEQHKGGSSITNHFTYMKSGAGNGGWDYEQQTDSSADGEKGGTDHETKTE